MKNIIIVLVAVMTMISCEKSEMLTPQQEVSECSLKSAGYEPSELAIMTLNGLICSVSGHQVSVVCDTLYYTYILESGQPTVTIENYEYFYFINEWGNLVYCNPEYLVLCDEL